jgi:carbamoyltransferase
MIIAAMYPCPFDGQDRHEFNSSLIHDDKIYSYEEGKITSIKNDGTPKFPERSLMLGFKELGILPNQVEKWVFPTPKTEVNIEDFYLLFSWYFKAYDGTRNEFEEWYREHVFFVEHQLSHASLAVYGSDFTDCAFLCMDGGGDFGDQRGYVFGEFSKNNFNVKFESTGVDTIANYHSFVTDAIGFSGDDNGKTSGLASYGVVQPKLKEDLSKLITISENDGVKFKRKRFSQTGINLEKIRADSYDRTKIFSQFPSDTNVLRLCIEYLPHDVAATGEKILQESVIKLVKLLRQHTNKTKIVFSGGLFQNVSLNKELLNVGFENVYFPSAPSDSGLSLGAALYVKNKGIDQYKPSNILSAYLGPSFSNVEVKEVLDRHRLIYCKDSKIAKTVAKILSEGKTVGWFQGRGEFGPRSLGNRSLVADPRKMESKERINQLLKKRDWFMPYAPSILEGEYSDWVEQSHYSPYMQVAFDIKSTMSSKVPSAVHVDGTSRVHVVRKSENLLYWELINEFKKITGVPVLLNTSFNRHGISTISTPRQAIEHLLEGCMDYLVIDDYIVAFDDNRIVADRYEKTEPEDKLLKINSINRLEVFKTHGTDMQMSKYLANLANLVGADIELSDNRGIKFLNKVFSIDSGQRAIISLVEGNNLNLKKII